ncbi:hypothetical protein [Aurantiacibacter zhengii]|uniref:hypothetical protein n=1 Tax=Aurantiacibacter zhengii TaxID=2307003 RepID=UPI0011C23063|nr:hypothetical protein [Aurantiacibacter zhengii]
MTAIFDPLPQKRGPAWSNQNGRLRDVQGSILGLGRPLYLNCASLADGKTLRQIIHALTG